MGKESKRGVLWLVPVGLALALAACGGGGASQQGPTDLGGGTADPPAIVGNIDALPAASDYPVAQQIEGASADAPLGTNPEFDVQPVSALVSSHQVSRTASELGPMELVKIDWITIAADGAAPDPADGNLVFAEGDLVDLWVQYEVADVEFSRAWKLDTAGLEFSEGYLYHGQAGVFQAKLDFQLPYGSASEAATFTVELGPPKTTSVVVGPVDHEDSASVGLKITEALLQEPLDYPPEPPSGLDPDAPECMPEWIDVVFDEELETVDVESESDLSNVVLQFGDYTIEKWDNLDEDLKIINSGTFYGTGENAGKLLRGIWVKSGCNPGGDGPGYGEFFPAFPEARQGMMVWEDLLAYPDYDYNDLVASMHCREFRNLSDEVVQVKLHVKALAHAPSYASAWQFNVEAAFPGAKVMTIVDQYYYTGKRHGPQCIWTSVEGVSVPVFSPTRDALPPPPDCPYATNGVAETTYVEGDYAIVTIILTPPRPASICTKRPYKPELRVKSSEGKVYIIGVWQQPGDPVDSNGRPLAFIVPDTFAWPLVGKKIWDCFPPFEAWVKWINDQSVAESYPVWSETSPEAGFFNREVFK